MSGIEEVRIGDKIIAFDGRVLELFGYFSEGRRVHASMIEGIEYAEGRLLGVRATIKVRQESNVGMSLSGDEGEIQAARELLDRAARGPH